MKNKFSLNLTFIVIIISLLIISFIFLIRFQIDHDKHISIDFNSNNLELNFKNKIRIFYNIYHDKNSHKDIITIYGSCSLDREIWEEKKSNNEDLYFKDAYDFTLSIPHFFKIDRGFVMGSEKGNEKTYGDIDLNDNYYKDFVIKFECNLRGKKERHFLNYFEIKNFDKNYFNSIEICSSNYVELLNIPKYFLDIISNCYIIEEFNYYNDAYIFEVKGQNNDYLIKKEEFYYLFGIIIGALISLLVTIIYDTAKEKYLYSKLSVESINSDTIKNDDYEYYYKRKNKYYFRNEKDKKFIESNEDLNFIRGKKYPLDIINNHSSPSSSSPPTLGSK